MSSSLFVPTVIETTGRGERAYDIFSRLLKERIIMVNGQIEDSMATLVVAQLLFLAAEDSKREINMYVNSPGGAVNAGLGIYDTMRSIPCPIVTTCVGYAASFGTILLMAGDPGRRLCDRNPGRRPLRARSPLAPRGTAGSRGVPGEQRRRAGQGPWRPGRAPGAAHRLRPSRWRAEASRPEHAGRLRAGATAGGPRPRERRGTHRRWRPRARARAAAAPRRRHPHAAPGSTARAGALAGGGVRALWHVDAPLL